MKNRLLATILTLLVGVSACSPRVNVEERTNVNFSKYRCGRQTSIPTFSLPTHTFVAQAGRIVYDAQPGPGYAYPYSVGCRGRVRKEKYAPRRAALGAGTNYGGR